MKTIPVTEEEVNQWMDECDAGLHPLTKEDKEALKRSRVKLMELLEESANNNPVQYFPA